jgi:TetR/AcrR family transcriptional regulator, repressor for neighboring sulfatase
MKASKPRIESSQPRTRARPARPAKRVARLKTAGNKAEEPTPRRRRSAEEARKRILEAAERELMRVGPEGLRLTDLARELRVSHPAILHHFGSREGLVAAVVQQTMTKLSEDMIAGLRDATDRDRLMDMVAEVCTGRGFARLSAWLMLSGRVGALPAKPDFPIRRMAEAVHALREHEANDASYEDTLFVLQLVAIALLGDAIFGAAVRRASAVDATPAAAQEFRRRLARLLPT